MVDAIEGKRGYGPPVFIDIRIRRSVRAAAFRDSAFEKLVGPDRYTWMRSLGNQSIITKENRIQIAEPSSAEDLLNVAVAAAKQKRRVIFFCGCPQPKKDGKISCHRRTVSNLVLAAARRRGIPVEIVEWPGGKAKSISVEVTEEHFKAIASGRMSIPLPTDNDPADWEGPPWATVATIRSGNQQIHRLVGPAVWKDSRWNLPVSWLFYDSDTPIQEYEEKAPRLVRSEGWELRKA